MSKRAFRVLGALALSGPLLLQSGLSQAVVAQFSAAQPSAAQPVQNLPTEILSLRAAPGSSLAYATRSSVQFSDIALHYQPRAGKSLSAAEQKNLAQLNAAAKAQLPQLKKALGGVSDVAGKQFIKVLPNDERGNTVLQITALTLPSTPGKSAPAPVSVIQIQAPDGHLLKLSGAVGPAAINAEAFLSRLTQGAGQLYGLALQPGQSRSSSQILDLGPLLGGVGALAGGSDLSAPLRANPLKVLVDTTYLGKNASGIRSYAQRFSAAPWALSVPGLKLAVNSWSGQGGQSFRGDGLPQTSDNTQNLGVTLLLDVPQTPVQLELTFKLSLISSTAVSGGA